MEIREHINGNIALVGLRGRFTIADQPNILRDAVSTALGHGARHVLLDLSGVNYLDSTRIGELIASHISVGRQGGRLKLVATPHRICELLTVAGLDRVFEMFATEEDAIKSLN